MARQIVVCMDGTWNDPTEQTNVYRLFQALPGTEERVTEKGPIRSHLRMLNDQLAAFYLEGVGARGRQQGLLGGSLGIGLHDRVIDAFVLVSQVYRPGDKIWIFGFSRGAWSARSLGGFIAGAGLLANTDAEGPTAVDEAERIWIQLKHDQGKENGARFWSTHDALPIRMLGVWDTVGALGIPLFNGLKVIDSAEKKLFDFADLDLSARVEHGRHALAIDETRFDFTPTLWHVRDGVQQVWFAGVHSDVGGGYANRGLSDIALEWMLQEINQLDAGLQIPADRLGVPLAPDCLQDRHDEARGLIWQTRPIRARELPADAVLHPTVMQRLEQRGDYRPQALKAVPACARFYPAGSTPPQERLLAEKETPPFRQLPVGGTKHVTVFAQKWWNASGVAVAPGERYRVEATGVWTDKQTPAGADGYDSDSMVLHFAEGSRRVKKSPWFALIAAMHPRPDLEAHNPDSGNMFTGLIESTIRGVSRVDGECRLLPTPSGSDIEVKETGFLYFFANDSAFAYSNNSGFLTVTVTRTA